MWILFDWVFDMILILNNIYLSFAEKKQSYIMTIVCIINIMIMTLNDNRYM